MRWLQELIIDKFKHYKWLMSYERIDGATIIPSGDPILLRIFFDALVQLIAHVVAYTGLAILLCLLIWEIFYAG